MSATNLWLLGKPSQYNHNVISDERARGKVKRLTDSHCSSLRHRGVCQWANQKPRQHSDVRHTINEFSRTTTETHKIVCNIITASLQLLQVLHRKKPHHNIKFRRKYPNILSRKCCRIIYINIKIKKETNFIDFQNYQMLHQYSFNNNKSSNNTYIFYQNGIK